MSETTVREIRPSDARALKSFVALERQWLDSNPLFVSEIDADVIKGLTCPGQICEARGVVVMAGRRLRGERP